MRPHLPTLFMMFFISLLTACAPANPVSRRPPAYPSSILNQQGQVLPAQWIDGDTARYRLEGDSFTIQVPMIRIMNYAKKNQRNPAVQICATTAEEAFSLVRSQLRTSDVPCFSGGTGMAPPSSDDALGMTLVVSNGEAHNYFSEDRRVNAVRDVFINIRGIEKRFGEPMASGPVYTTVFVDRNANEAIDEGEYDLFILDFGL